MDDETQIRGRMALNRIMATLALPGAIVCAHYAYQHDSWSDWRGWVWGIMAGLLCQITIKSTFKAAVYASGLVTVEAFKKVNR